ncbi:MAG: L,D-transpeptidase family protein [Candidatus Komeilibacteria bacterium]|nr:L,D-transpeptidase family protein [Candidatus Komeilibacteria bacterium]
MKRYFFIIYIIAGLLVLGSPFLVQAQALDTDGDGLTDEQEINIYYTNPYSADTDADGFTDKVELDTGFSPHRPLYKLSQLDWDKDGLSDEQEINLGTDLKNADTDGDGFSDKIEVYTGYDPLSTQRIKVAKKIEINLAEQELSYFFGNAKLGSFDISGGLPRTPTPKGEFQIYNKIPKAWSTRYKLWMPYWMAFYPSGLYGLHELPYWPGGYREGSDHLGKPASHGCVRLGIGPAKVLYDWAEIGTPVIIY